MVIIKNSTKLFKISFFLIIFLSTLSLLENPTLRFIGEQGIALLFIISLIYLTYYISKNQSILRQHYQLFISFLLLFIFYTYSFILYGDDTTFFTVFQFSLFFSFVIVVIFLQKDHKTLNMMTIFITLFTLILFILWINLGKPLFKYTAFFRNPNALGAILLTFTYFTILKIQLSKNYIKYFYFGILLLQLLLIYSSSSRTVWLVLLVIALAWLIYHFKNKYFKFLFFSVLGFMFLFNIFYIKSRHTNIGTYLNELSIHLIGKSFYSGRETLWSELFQHAMNSIVLGYGAGTNFSAMNTSGKPPHNLYLQIILESGIISLIIFVFILYYIWKLLLNNLNKKAVQLSAFYFIGLLVYHNFESTFFPGTVFAIGIFQWLIITFGINYKSTK